MKRNEAVDIFRRICKCIPVGAVFRGVSLVEKKRLSADKEMYELRINVDLSRKNLQEVKLIVERFGKAFEEAKGTLVIYAPSEPRALEILA